MPNVARLEALWAELVSHPENHNAGYWARRTECGTEYCSAGTVVVQAGHKLQWYKAGEIEVFLMYGSTTSEIELATFIADGSTTIARKATELLGITSGQSQQLFYRHHTLDQIGEIIKDLINEAQVEETDNG
jgi:hypothetical protein